MMLDKESVAAVGAKIYDDDGLRIRHGFYLVQSGRKEKVVKSQLLANRGNKLTKLLIRFVTSFRSRLPEWRVAVQAQKYRYASPLVSRK